MSVVRLNHVTPASALSLPTHLYYFIFNMVSKLYYFIFNKEIEKEPTIYLNPTFPDFKQILIG